MNRFLFGLAASVGVAGLSLPAQAQYPAIQSATTQGLRPSDPPLSPATTRGLRPNAMPPVALPTTGLTALPSRSVPQQAPFVPVVRPAAPVACGGVTIVVNGRLVYRGPAPVAVTIGDR